MADCDAPQTRQHTRFLFLYALAWVGGSIAYVPLLTLILPVRVSLLAGEAAVTWLAYFALVGAVAASVANIGFGWLSDILRDRRCVAAIGLVLSCLLLVAIGAVERLSTLLFVIGAWQLSLNMMLSPLAAWAGDSVPDHQKGQLGGLLSIAPAAAAGVGIIVTIPGLATENERLWMLAGIVVMCVLPALVAAKPRPFPVLMEPAEQAGGDGLLGLEPHSRTVGRMWLARLLVQITEAAIFAYLFLWLKTLSSAVTDNTAAWVYSVVLFVGIPLAMIAGRWADARNKPIVPLAAAAIAVAVGLFIMGLAQSFLVAVLGYFLFGVAGAVFLALHSAQTLSVLPRPQTRGRDLGLFNLTNTIPSVVMPGLTLALVPVSGFAGLFFLLGILALTAFWILIALTQAA